MKRYLIFSSLILLIQQTHAQCNPGSYLSGASCVSCPSGFFSLGGARSSSACISEPFKGPLDTVWSYSCDSSEGTSAFSVLGSPSFAANAYGEAGKAIKMERSSVCSGQPQALSSLSSLEDLPLGTKFSLSFSSRSINYYDHPGVIQLGHPNYFRISDIQVNSGNSGKMTLYYIGGALVTNVSIQDWKWHAIVVTANTLTGRVVFYIDGVPAGETTPSGSGITYTYASFPSPAGCIALGAQCADSYCSWSGYLDDVRIYNRELSASEALTLSQPFINYPDTVVNPPSPTAFASSYTFSCPPGLFGPAASLIRASSDNSWSWVSTDRPSCTACPAGVSTSASGSASVSSCSICIPGYNGTVTNTGTSSASGCSICPANTYSYGGSGSCSSCSSMSAFISSTSGCFPLKSPSDTSFYLSGSQIEGVSAFPTITSASGITHVTSIFNTTNGALSLASGSYLSAPGFSLSRALPSGGNVPWTASAWVKCASSMSSTWAAALEWGSLGDDQGFLADTSASLVVGSSIGSGLKFGSATTIQAGYPFLCAMAVDESGNVYATPQNHHIVIKITPTGTITIIASGLHYPCYLAIDTVGNVYVGDLNGAILKIPISGSISNYASGADIAIHSPSGNMYVTDASQSVKRISPSGSVTVITSSMNRPYGIAVDINENIFVADTYNSAIKRITPQGVITTIGSGFDRPHGVAVDRLGNVYVADTGNRAIKVVTPLGAISTIYTTSSSIDMYHLAVDSSGNVYTAEYTSYTYYLTKIPAVGMFIPACDSTWHHVAISYSPAAPSQLFAYIDGKLNAQAFKTISLPSSSEATLRIGWNGNLNANSGSLYSGALSDLRIYNRTLSTNEIITLSQPVLSIYANARTPSQVVGSKAYTWYCSAGFYGPYVTLSRSSTDGTWSISDGYVNCQSCPANTYSYMGATSCSSCPYGSTLISSSLGCRPSTLFSSGPNDTSFYLSGSQLEGLSAFPNASTVYYSQSPFDDLNGALTFFSSEKFLSFIPSNGSALSTVLPTGISTWTASAWVKCAASMLLVSTSSATLVSWANIGDSTSTTLSILPSGLSKTCDGKWHHLAVTRGAGATGAITSYFDGNAAILPASPLAVYTFANGGQDESGNNRNCQVQGSAPTSPTTGMQITAQSHGVKILPSIASSAITISLGYNMAYFSGTWHNLASNGHPGYVHIHLNTGTGAFGLWNNGFAGTNFVPTPGIINYYTIVARGTEWSFFVNGKFITNTTNGFNNADRPLEYLATPSLLWTQAPFGFISKVVIYDRALSYAEVQQVYAWQSTSLSVTTLLSSCQILVNVPIPLMSVVETNNYVSGTGEGCLTTACDPQCYNVDQNKAGFGNPYNFLVTFSSPAILTSFRVLGHNDGDHSIAKIDIYASQGGSLIGSSSSADSSGLLIATISSTSIYSSVFVVITRTGPWQACVYSLKPIGYYASSALACATPFLGSLAELRVYSRVLSSAEVLSLSQPFLPSYANAVTPVLSTGASSYSFPCAVGFYGVTATRTRSSVNFSWSWSNGITPNCTSCPSQSSTSALGSTSITACNVCKPGYSGATVSNGAGCIACSSTSYSYGGATCSSCPFGAIVIPGNARGCRPSSLTSSSPTDTSFYLSGSQIEGVSAFPVIVNSSGGLTYSSTSFSSYPSVSLTFSRGSYISTPLLPSLPTGSSPFTVSSWVKCNASLLSDTNPSSVIVSWGASDVSTSTSLRTGTLAVTNKVRENDILTVSTFAGTGVLGYVDGPGNTAEFDYPQGIAIDVNGNIYVAEYYSHSIRKISPVGFVTTLAGSGGPGLSDGMGGNAKFNYPLGLAVDPLGNVFVADESNHCVRKITPTGNVTTLAGNGTSGSEDGNRTIARLSHPLDVALDIYGNIYVAEKTGIRKISPLGVVSTLAGNRGSLGFTNGMGTSALFNFPYGIVVDYLGNVLVSDTGNNCIRKISPSGNVTTIAGLCGSDNSSSGLVNDVGTNARFYSPIGIDIDKSGNIYIADTINDVIRKISSSNVVTTFVGSSPFGFIDGQLTAAKFYGPTSIALSSSGSEMYVADSDNYRIRKIAIPLPGPLPICDTNSTWHHIALTYTGSSSTNLLTAYVDGSQISSTSASFAISSISTSSLRLGWNGLTPVNSAGEHFSGSMSDIRIYNRSLSLSEITLLKNPPPTPTSSPTPSSSPTRTSSTIPSSSPTSSSTQSKTPSSTSTTSQVTNLLTTTKDVNGTDSLSSFSLTTIILILVGSNILLGVCVLICVFFKIRNRAIVHPLSSIEDERNEPKTLQEQLKRLRERKLKVLVDNADIVDTEPISTRVLYSSSQGMVQSPPSSSSSSLQTTSAVPSYIHPNSNEELEKTMEFAGNVRVYHQLSKLRNKLEKKKKINSPESGV